MNDNRGMAKKTASAPCKTFTIVARVTGGLGSSYVFSDEDEYETWRRRELPPLEKEFGRLTVRKDTLPGFAVGDYCMVYGEGFDVFEIEGLRQYSPHRYGFVLKDHGCEEVAKCFWKEGAERL